MKRFAALFLAVIALAGCSSKKSSDTEPPVENDDKAVEEEVKIYSKDDFKRVDLALQTEKKDMGKHMEEIDVSALDFGERLSPCKTVDDPYKNKLEWTDISNYDELFEESLKTPAKGRAISAAMDGRTVYIFVSYDPMCGWLHSLSIFRYDMDTHACSEYCHFEEPEERYLNESSYQIVDGRIFHVGYIDSTCIMEVDPATGRESVFYDGDDPISWLMRGEDHTLHAAAYSGDIINTMVIDITTGEQLNSEQLKTWNGMPAGADGMWHTEITPGTEKDLDIVTDKFRISTGLRMLDGAFIRGSSISILVTLGNSGYDEQRLYTYDTDKMEVYVTDVSSLGMPYKMDDNLLFVYNSGDMIKTSYFVPEIGTAFEQDKIRANVGYAGLSYGGMPMLSVLDDENNIEKLLLLPEGEQ